MARVEISNDELWLILQDCRNAYYNPDSIVYNVLNVLHNRGLRINEVLETWRWTMIDQNYADVQLEKGDAVRRININNFYSQVQKYWRNQIPLPYTTYSSINYRVKKATPVIVANSDPRRCTTHLFRYSFCKTKHEAGWTDQEIQEELQHASLASTQRYIYDKMYRIT